MQNVEQSKENPTEKLPLPVRFALLKVHRPKLNQEKIARPIRSTQGSVSRAMREPHIVPDVAKKIEKFFDRLEAQSQSTQPTTAAHA